MPGNTASKLPPLGPVPGPYSGTVGLRRYTPEQVATELLSIREALLALQNRLNILLMLGDVNDSTAWGIAHILRECIVPATGMAYRVAKNDPDWAMSRADLLATRLHEDVWVPWMRNLHAQGGLSPAAEAAFAALPRKHEDLDVFGKERARAYARRLMGLPATVPQLPRSSAPESPPAGASPQKDERERCLHCKRPIPPHVPIVSLYCSAACRTAANFGGARDG